MTEYDQGIVAKIFGKAKEKHSVDAIAADVFSKLTDEDIKYINDVATRDDMIQFHHTAGMDIRNNYGLWSPNHPLTLQWRKDEGKIVNGVDEHPDHPDAVSMRVLYRVWDMVHDV